MARRHIRELLDRTADATGVLSLLERRLRGGLIILTFHHVLPDEEFADYPVPTLAIPLSWFEQQVAALALHFSVLPVREALAEIGRPSGKHDCFASITFDDGYQDNVVHAAPVLESAGLRGTFFITTGFLGGGGMLWFDRVVSAWQSDAGKLLATIRDRSSQPTPEIADLGAVLSHLKSLEPGERDDLVEKMPSTKESAPALLMSEEDVADLHVRGHEIGSHTVSHPLLPQLDDASLTQELVGSRSHLEGLIGESIRGFCYPNGDHDARVDRAVRDAGYSYACTTAPGVNRAEGDSLALRRLHVSPGCCSTPGGSYSSSAFRGEVSLFHEIWR